MALRIPLRRRHSTTPRTKLVGRRYRPPRDAGVDANGSGLVPPKFQVYKRFLYIDGSEVLNTLAALEGGAAEEVIQQTHDEGSLNVGLAIKQWAGVEIGAGKKSTLQQEVRLKRTAHSAVESFLAELEQGGGMGFLSRRCSDEEWGRLEENMVLRVDAFLDVVVEGNRPLAEPELSFFQRLFGQEPPAPEPDRWVIALADGDRDPGRLVMELEGTWLVAKSEELARAATVVAQIDRILRDGEKGSLAHDGTLSFGESDDPFTPLRTWNGPAAFLRAICIYK